MNQFQVLMMKLKMSQRKKHQFLHRKKKSIKKSLQTTTLDKATLLNETSPTEKYASYVSRKFSKPKKVPNLKMINNMNEIKEAFLEIETKFQMKTIKDNMMVILKEIHKLNLKQGHKWGLKERSNRTLNKEMNHKEINMLKKLRILKKKRMTRITKTKENSKIMLINNRMTLLIKGQMLMLITWRMQEIIKGDS